MKFFLDLLSDKSDVSMMRFLSLIVVIVACYVALTKGDENINTIIALLSSGFGGKFLQKVVENGQDR